jgi:hypothetical protein
MRSLIRSLAPAVTAVALLTTMAAAQTPTRVRGTIEKIDAQSMTVKSREGHALEIKLAENLNVSGVVHAPLSDIKAGTFVGAAALAQPDGTLKALEVLIFPESMRGSGEGHYAWDLMPESTMTNATVAETVAGVSGPTLTLRYKDGEKKIVVPSDAPIVTFVPGDRSLLKPGTAVMFSATPQADGKLMAARVAAGKDGVVPPM